MLSSLDVSSNGEEAPAACSLCFCPQDPGPGGHQVRSRCTRVSAGRPLSLSHVVFFDTPPPFFFIQDLKSGRGMIEGGPLSVSLLPVPTGARRIHALYRLSSRPTNTTPSALKNPCLFSQLDRVSPFCDPHCLVYWGWICSDKHRIMAHTLRFVAHYHGCSLLYTDLTDSFCMAAVSFPLFVCIHHHHTVLLACLWRHCMSVL